jgi:hypothetical protein
MWEVMVCLSCVLSLLLTFSELLHVMQPDTLIEHIKFDHGYTSKSPAIINVSFLV